jgi:hypothetical protein
LVDNAKRWECIKAHVYPRDMKGIYGLSLRVRSECNIRLAFIVQP